jgi:hypothetical protein
MAFLVFPRYRFRPSHCDALHVDLWVDGEPVLRDGGTYCYAAEPYVQEAFTGAAGHSTVQFDGREQMPRLGRFLLGSWLPDAVVTPTREDGNAVTLGASYGDAAGAFHARTLTLETGAFMVHDRVSGFRSSAVLRWRLRPGDWRIEGQTVTDGRHRLEVSADVPIIRAGLVEGWESREYMRRSTVPILEVEIAAPGTWVTRYGWAT